MEQLTPQEEQLMRFVWQAGKGFVKDFREMYPDRKPPYTTLATTMKKLESKGYVSAKLYGNTYEYRPRIRQDRYKTAFVGNVVSNYFQNSYKEMVTFFAQQEKLSEKDLQEILQMIKEK
ncbi:transcriptional regulator [Bacteroidia bacterium]|nr:transcriptional regulator [Bacteroidia bacterium]